MCSQLDEPTQHDTGPVTRLYSVTFYENQPSMPHRTERVWAVDAGEARRKVASLYPSYCATVRSPRIVR